MDLLNLPNDIIVRIISEILSDYKDDLSELIRQAGYVSGFICSSRSMRLRLDRALRGYFSNMLKDTGHPSLYSATQECIAYYNGGIHCYSITGRKSPSVVMVRVHRIYVSRSMYGYELVHSSIRTITDDPIGLAQCKMITDVLDGRSSPAILLEERQ